MSYAVQSTFLHIITRHPFKVVTILPLEEFDEASLRTDGCYGPVQHQQSQNPGCLTNLAI